MKRLRFTVAHISMAILITDGCHSFVADPPRKRVDAVQLNGQPRYVHQSVQSLTANYSYSPVCYLPLSHDRAYQLKICVLIAKCSLKIKCNTEPDIHIRQLCYSLRKCFAKVVVFYRYVWFLVKQVFSSV